MIDPFTAWFRLAGAAMEMSQTAVRAGQMLGASQDIVAKRTRMIDDAVRNPLTGDYAELSRMMPEKVEAFSQSGVAVASEIWSMQAAMLGEMQHFWGMALRGRAPTLGEMSATATRVSAFGLRSVERTAALGSTGLAPIAKQVATNTRRLKRSPKTR